MDGAKRTQTGLLFFAEGSKQFLLDGPKLEALAIVFSLFFGLLRDGAFGQRFVDRASFEDGFANLRGDELDRADCIVIAGNDYVDEIWIAVRVNDCNDRDTQLAGLGDGDGFLVEVHHKHARGKLIHVADTFEIAIKLIPLFPSLEGFLLGESIEIAVGFHPVELFESVDAEGNRLPVGQSSTKPALRDPVLP